MSKSKCELCGKQLKSGEWMLRANDDGKVIKVCNDRDGCQKRIRGKTVGLGASVGLVGKRKARL